MHHDKKLVGFELSDRGIPRTDYDILDSSGNLIGRVTSGSISPMTNKGIGLGYISCSYAQPGNEIYIKIRNKVLKAFVKKFPLF